MSNVQLKKAEIPDGGAKVIKVKEGMSVAVFRVGDRVAAINDRCPHAGASLGIGAFDGTTVKCPLHGFRVDVWKGVGNGGKPVQTFPATCDGEDICIDVSGGNGRPSL